MATATPSPAAKGRGPGAAAALRLVLPAVLTLVLFTAALFVVILPAIKNNALERKREMTRELVQTALGTLAHYHALEASGRLSRAQAQARAVALLRRQRYGPDRKDYFWINDETPRIVMHPYRPELEGRDVSGFTDPTGKRLFAEMVEVVRRQGRGYVDYRWQWKDDPERIVPKLSYVAEFEPWGWIVGTGIYVEDVNAEIADLTGRLTTVALAILGLVALLEVVMVSQAVAAERRRRAAETELTESQRMLRLVMDNIPQRIYWKDRSGAYLGCNQAFAAYAGLAEPADIAGRTDHQLPAASVESGWLRVAEERVMNAGRPELHVIEPQVAPAGEVWWSDTSRIPLRDGEGRVVGVLCTFQDITDRRRTEEALRESERRFRTLVENSLAGILIVQEGEVLYLNPEARRLCGELAPRLRLENLAAAPAEDRRRLAELAARPPGEGPWELELRLARSGQAGGYRWVHCRANRMEHQGREALLLLLLDISRARELEHMLRVQDKMASLGRVAAGIAHEIRNPLSGVTMYLSALEGLAEADCTPEEVRRIAGRIRRAAGRIEAVMKRVLDFSRPAAPRLAWVSVNRVIREVIELSQVTLRKSRVEVTTDLAPELPLCHADAQLLEQVLMNLVTNAVQALAEAEGPRRIEIASGLSGGSVVIRVADSGPGVPPEAGERIFDPFFTIKKDGSGIGLALSQRIVSDHGGRLTAGVSRWGGAEFTIEMPTTFYWGYDSHG